MFTSAQSLGVRCIEVEGPLNDKTNLPQFDPACVKRALQEILDSISEE